VARKRDAGDRRFLRFLAQGEFRSGADADKYIMYPSPGAVDPASRFQRRYADAPAAALLTGLGAGEWSPLRSRPYARIFELSTAMESTFSGCTVMA
jgi:hypothetical protein